MSHYFDLDENVKSQEFSVKFDIQGKHFSFISDNGVFSKDELDDGSLTLITSALKENLFGRVLDLGCGIGTVGIVLKSFIDNIKVDFVDVNERALNLTRKNIDNLKLDDCNVFYSDGYKNITELYDYIITNPPIRAGKVVVYDFILNSFDHLKDNGVLLVVMRKSHGAPSAKKHLEEKFGNCEIVSRNKGFYILKSIKK